LTLSGESWKRAKSAKHRCASALRYNKIGGGTIKIGFGEGTEGICTSENLCKFLEALA